MDLAAYAMRDAEGLGRRFAEPTHPYRSDYERDRDRLLHSKAFRRLEKKTQVFAPDYSDHFRNRLTHTLEVTQISRTIGQALRLNAQLCEALALSHDIGHPPFGHEGEKVLNERMSAAGSSFDHNLHALRIVEDFEEKYPAFRGLNLTFEVREGIVKHSRDYDSDEGLDVPLKEYRLGFRPPLEAQLIDLADEIAYNTADLDDGYDSGLLSVEAACERVTLFARLHDSVKREFSAASEKLKFSETVRRLINTLVTSLITQTGSVVSSAGLASVEDVRSHPERLVAFEPRVRRENGELKEFLRTELYSHPVLIEARATASRQIRELFDHYLVRPEDMPESRRTRIGILGAHRVVCDYIAGMTDNFARKSHRAALEGRPAV